MRKSVIRKVIEEGEAQSDWNKGYACLRLGIKPTPENKKDAIFVERQRRTKTMEEMRKKIPGRLIDKWWEYPTFSPPRFQYFFFKHKLQKALGKDC